MSRPPGDPLPCGHARSRIGLPRRFRNLLGFVGTPGHGLVSRVVSGTCWGLWARPVTDWSLTSFPEPVGRLLVGTLDHALVSHQPGLHTSFFVEDRSCPQRRFSKTDPRSPRSASVLDVFPSLRGYGQSLQGTATNQQRKTPPRANRLRRLINRPRWWGNRSRWWGNRSRRWAIDLAGGATDLAGGATDLSG